MSNHGPRRLAAGGRIDRTRPLAFFFDGRPLVGFAGDTLASALLANGVSLVGRSFKYHRPRGFLADGADEPNGLVTLEGVPNIAATTVDLVDGLRAHSQNAWPSLRFDLRSLNGVLSPLLSAGFYYKTFMGPTRGSWMFYERFIRRAAGLGKAHYERDSRRYQTRYAFADVLVVGSGPAGIAATLCAAQTGMRVTLVERDALLGGCLLRDRAAEAWRAQAESQLGALENLEIRRRTTAFGIYDHNEVALLDRDGLTCLTARAIVFATGASEQPLVFANNDRPGVMLASAVRGYLHRFAVACGVRPVIVTNNDSAYDTAFDLAQLGYPTVLADSRRTPSRSLHARCEELGIELLHDTRAVDVIGRTRMRGIVLQTGSSPGRLVEHPCDVVCMSGGWAPLRHLACHASKAGSEVPGQFAAGGMQGTLRYAQAIEEGMRAAGRATEYLGLPRFVPHRLPDLPGDEAECAFVPDTHGAPRRASKAFVDFQNDVTTHDIVIAHQEGYESAEHLKRYTTLGMGTDQGRTSHFNGVALMASLRRTDITSAGTTTFRPPFTPVPIGALAGRHIGAHFRPVRRTPLHDWHRDHGATMIEAGPWLRPWFYDWAGSSVSAAHIKEMRHVRTGVGITDISTLGKIEVQGPHARELLNRVYVNDFSTLKPGKARYGVMLRDDGAVLDDGTALCLSDTRFFVTTSTAHADEVLSWLEFLVHTAWTDLDVHLTSVTDEWATLAIAGPRSREALERAFPGQDFSNTALPHMGCVEASLNGRPIRVLRLSFSGELAFEVYTPAGHGVDVWQHVLSRARSLDIRPYGLEALASLRIEKGYIAGLELDHRNTLDDLGLSRMAAANKDFVGKTLRQRPALQAADRWSLVGIESLEPGKTLRGGSILFAANDPVRGHGRGYITSATWSTELNRFIALGLFRGGLKHAGAEIVCAYPLKHEQVRARIVPPNFVDPEGQRLRT